MNKNQLHILEYIKEHPKTYSNQISKDLGIDNDTVLRHVKKLKETGYIKTSVSHKDMRIIYLSATERGMSAV